VSRCHRLPELTTAKDLAFHGETASPVVSEAQSSRTVYHPEDSILGQHGDKSMPSNWSNRPRPAEKSAEPGRSYNGTPGKSAEDETARA
jgi:hypothetical protein